MLSVSSMLRASSPPPVEPGEAASVHTDAQTFMRASNESKEEGLNNYGWKRYNFIIYEHEGLFS
jgi:hypothetical protein